MKNNTLKQRKNSLSFKLLSSLLLLSFISDFVFMDYASAILIKKSKTALMDEEPITRRAGDTSNQQVVDDMNMLAALMASPQTATPSNIVFTSDTPNQVGEMDARSHAEMLAALNLVKDVDATLTISGNVNLSALLSSGQIQDGAKLVISEGSVLTIDAVSTIKIDWIRVDGKIKFSTDRDTQLKVGTLVVNTMGALNIGSKDDRIQADKTAKLIFADMGSVFGDPNDRLQIGHGLIGMGAVEMYGAETASNVMPASSLIKGATSMTLSAAAAGWKAGDQLLLSSTANSQGWNSIYSSEKITIQNISADGKTITFNSALAFDHVMPDGSSVPVARMTRNLQVSSENQTDIMNQGHIMIMGYGELDGASFTGLGRTTNLIVTDPIFNAQGQPVDTTGRVIVFHKEGDYIDAQGRFIVFNADGNFTDGAGNVVDAQNKLVSLNAAGKFVNAQGQVIVSKNAQSQYVDAQGNIVRIDGNGNFVDAAGNLVFFVRRIVENVRGRYAVHFHRTGITADSPLNIVRDSYIDAGAGAVVARWGGANHASKVNWIDNAFHGFSGTNLMADEKGDAIGLVQGNITNKSDGALSVEDFRFRGGFTYSNAIGQVAEDVGHRGHGIYLQGGGGVLVQGNWVFGNKDAGIIYWRLNSKDGGKTTWYPLENILDQSVLDSLRPGNIVDINGAQWVPGAGKQYISIDSIPIYCIGNVIGSSGNMIMLAYNMMGHTKSAADIQASHGYSVVKDNIGFGFVSGGVLLNYSIYVHIENNIILRQNPNAANPSFVYGVGIAGNDFTSDITMVNNTIRGFDQGISVPANGTIIIRGGELENIINIEVRAPFHGDLALDVDIATSARPVLIDGVKFKFYTTIYGYGSSAVAQRPFSDIRLQGQEDVYRVEGYDYGAWDFDRNPVIIRGENLDSLILRMDYKGAIASGENPNHYYYSNFVSPNVTNTLNGYIAIVRSLYTNNPNFTGSPVDLIEGLNIIKVRVGTVDQSLIVFGDSHGPSFVPNPDMKLEIKAGDLSKGFDLTGLSVDRNANLQFEQIVNKHFDNLVADANGNVKIQFEIRDRAGNVSFVSLDIKVIENVVVIPLAVQATADNLQQQLGDGYTVEIKLDEANPGNYLLVVHVAGVTPLVGQASGTLTSLTFSTDASGALDVASIQATFSNGSVDGPMLYTGLTQLSGVNPFAAMSSMLLESSDSTGIVFDLNGNSLKITKDAQGKVILTAISYDVLIKIGEKYKLYGRATNDLQRGDLLRQSLRDLKAGETLMLGEGRFDCDGKTRGVVRFPNNITVIGRGGDKTHLYSNSYGDGQGAGFQVRNGTYSDLTFENQSWDVYEDGRTIEMYDGLKFDDKGYYVYENGHKVVEEANVGPFTVNFDHVKFIGSAWTVYDWSGRGHTWNITDCAIVSGRQGVSMMSGGGEHSQTATILRTTFDIDTMRSQDIGWTSNRNVGGAYGIVARGGHIKVEDCTFNIKGGLTPNQYSFAPRAVGIYDGNDFDSTSSAWTFIELINNHWNIDGRGAKDTYDIFMTNQGVKDRLRISGGYGSGPNGLITKNWTGSDIPPVLPLSITVKALLANLRALLPHAYVGAYADPSAPGSYVFNIVQDIASIGHIRLLEFVTDGEGHIADTKPMAVTFTMTEGDRSVDAKMLLAGLAQISRNDAVSLVNINVLNIATDGSIRFELDGTTWNVSKNAVTGIVTMTRDIPAAVQAMADNLQTQVGADYTVRVTPVDGRYTVIMTSRVNISGELRILRFSVDENGVMDSSSLFSVYRKTDGTMIIVDANLLLAALSQIAPVTASPLVAVVPSSDVEKIVTLTDILLDSASSTSINFAYNNENWNVSKDANGIITVLPVAILKLKEDLQAKLGDTRVIRIFKDSLKPGNYSFIIYTTVAQEGHIRTLRFSTDSKGVIDITRPMLAVFTLPGGISKATNGKMLFEGLAQMPGVNVLHVIADMTVQSIDTNSIRFAYNNAKYEIQKDAAGIVKLIQAMQPIKLAVQTSPYANASNLFVSVDEYRKATVTYQGQTYTGTYTEFILGKGTSFQRIYGRVTISIDENRSWTATILSMDSPFNIVSIPPYLMSFASVDSDTTSAFIFNQEGLLTFNSEKNTNYSSEVRYTYIKINDKNYIESIIQSGHSSNFVSTNGPALTTSAPIPANGYSWTSKTFYAYDLSGEPVITLSLSSNTPDSGQAAHYASYSLNEGDKQVRASVLLDIDISTLIHSAQDYKVIDQYATMKSEYYKNSQMTLTSVKDSAGVFIPRYIQLGSKAYIVQGQPDLLYPNDTVKDILIQPWQNINGYSVYYGAAYSYTYSGTNSSYGTSKYLGYGLVFSKWGTKADGTSGQINTVVDFPKTNTVVLDGKTYEIKIDAEGAVKLQEPIMTVIVPAASIISTVDVVNRIIVIGDKKISIPNNFNSIILQDEVSGFTATKTIQDLANAIIAAKKLYNADVILSTKANVTLKNGVYELTDISINLKINYVISTVSPGSEVSGVNALASTITIGNETYQVKPNTLLTVDGLDSRKSISLTQLAALWAQAKAKGDKIVLTSAIPFKVVQAVSGKEMLNYWIDFKTIAAPVSTPTATPAASVSWIQVQMAESFKANEEITVQFKLLSAASNGNHVHCYVASSPVTADTLNKINFDKLVMAFPDSTGAGKASLTTKETGKLFVSFWGVTKDHEYDGKGITVRVINVTPDESVALSDRRRKAEDEEEVFSAVKKKPAPAFVVAPVAPLAKESLKVEI